MTACHSTANSLRPAHAQSGVVLITGLIFMVILTLIVLALLRSGTLEERMALNARNHQIALQAAEAMLRDGEASSFSAATIAAPFDPYTGSSFTATCTNGLCTRPAAGATPRWKSVDWSSAGFTRTFAVGSLNIGGTLVPSQPKYIIEVYSPTIMMGHGIPCSVAYRVTSRGAGQDSSEVFVQSMYQTRPAKC
jgi:type IV pilus assembly protein PilX